MARSWTTLWVLLLPVSDGLGGAVSWDGAQEEERVERICSAVHGAHEMFGVCICGIRWQENSLENVSCSGAREDVCLGRVALIRNSKYRRVKKGLKGAGLSMPEGVGMQSRALVGSFQWRKTTPNGGTAHNIMSGDKSRTKRPRNCHLLEETKLSS